MSVCNFTLLIGRILISILFLYSGIMKFVNFEETSQWMASKGFTMVPFFLFAAAVVEILGGLALLLGYQIRWAAGILFLYLIPVTLIFHNFWTMSGTDRQHNTFFFFDNLAIMGGLLYVLGVGAGKWSMDRCCSQSSPTIITKP